MSDIETKVDKLDERVSSLERQVSTTMAKVDTIIGEMRDRDNQRAAEIMEMRQKHDADMKDMQKNFYAKMDAMDAKIDGISKHISMLTVTSMGAIGAIVITVIISLIKG